MCIQMGMKARGVPNVDLWTSRAWIRSASIGSQGGQLNRASATIGLLSYFSFQPVFHDWRNKGRGMCYPVCRMLYDY